MAMRSALFNRRQNPLFHVATFPIAKLGMDVEDYAHENKVPLGNTDIVASNKFLTHCQREAKGALRVSESVLINFPYTSQQMEVYYDKKCFIYTDRKVKFIVSPNYKLKTRTGALQSVNLITAGMVTSPNEFDNSGHYERVR